MTQDECYKKLKSKIPNKYFCVKKNITNEICFHMCDMIDYEIYIAPNIKKTGKDLYKLYRSVIASLREKKKKIYKNTLGVNKNDG